MVFFSRFLESGSNWMQTGRRKRRVSADADHSSVGLWAVLGVPDRKQSCFSLLLSLVQGGTARDEDYYCLTKIFCLDPLPDVHNSFSGSFSSSILALFYFAFSYGFLREFLLFRSEATKIRNRFFVLKLFHCWSTHAGLWFTLDFKSSYLMRILLIVLSLNITCFCEMEINCCCYFMSYHYFFECPADSSAFLYLPPNKAFQWSLVMHG